ncbi:hypothetical protein HDU76_013586 [Blyttiomyces sp. JEL0837]|nr:hypothetical protein HDU76_013586 [Blyttiomyces sp. JEL0837]
MMIPTTHLLTAISLAILHLTNPSTAATTPALTAKGLPPDGSLIIGGWLNTYEYPPDLDNNVRWNKALGYNSGSFQVRQSIPPLINETDGTQIIEDVTKWQDKTNASVFFTLYADHKNATHQGLDFITNDELTKLAIQLKNITDLTGRTVFLRYLPEMNGEWMYYGTQPERFVASWKTMAKIMRQIAPNVILVWSPNFDLNSRGDNGGGQPYWPGADYVDWVGASQYWKASQSLFWGQPFGGNTPAPANYFANSINYVYTTYAQGYNKPFVLSEASAAWEIPFPGDPVPADHCTQAEMQYTYWSQVINSTAIYPLFKMAQVFEYKKPEDRVIRDFRVSWNTSVTAAFLRALQPLNSANRIAWAVSTASTTTGGGDTGTSTGTGSTQTVGTKTPGSGAVGIAASQGLVGLIAGFMVSVLVGVFGIVTL